MTSLTQTGGPATTTVAEPLPTPAKADRFAMLDGWRAASILLVLAGHLLPIGPKSWEMNGAVAASGMVIFFNLSGFLIIRFLSSHADLRVFIIRRFFRIVPLAWLVMIVLLTVASSPLATWAANLLFYANLPPQHLVVGGGHLWSLCVEMQFYVGAAVFVALFGSRALIILPLAAAGVTLARVIDHRYLDIVTWYRCDEIFAGGVLALTYAGVYGNRLQNWLAWLNPLWLLPLVLLSAHPIGGWFQYFRPYVAALMVGSSLYGAPSLLVRTFEHRVTTYIATVSYAVYIIHGALVDSWLGTGDRLVKYAKRPLLIGVTFLLAHLSTFKFEQPCVALAKRLTRGTTVKLPA